MKFVLYIDGILYDEYADLDEAAEAMRCAASLIQRVFLCTWNEDDDPPPKAGIVVR